MNQDGGRKGEDNSLKSLKGFIVDTLLHPSIELKYVEQKNGDILISSPLVGSHNKKLKKILGKF